MNLKELIVEVEELKKNKENDDYLIWIKKTVEAVEDMASFYFILKTGEYKDWQKLKKLLGVK